MQKRTLNNGLKVICYPIEHAMSVEIGLYIRAGARYENKENNGITHLLEHMHFRQLGDMNQKDIYGTMELMGTSLRGTTHKEMLCFNVKVRPKYLEKSLDIFEKILTTYDWTEEQLESEKKVVINEIYEKEDEVTLEKIYDKAIWRKNPLKRGILGSEENVKGFTVDDLVGYKKEIFSKNNVTLVITGAIDEEKSREIFEEFGKIKINEGVERKEKVEVIKGRQFKREPDVKLKNFASWNIVDVQLSFDVDLTKIKENELLFLNSIIGGGDGSYLQTEIRENQGLVYDIYSCVDIFSKESILSIIFSIDKSRLQLSILEIIKILKQLKNIISKKDVDRNMAFFTENLWYWAEETKELNFQLGSDFLNDKEVLTIEDRIMANERIDFQRMREISEMIFRKENMSLIVIGPTKGITENKLRELLYGKYDNEYNEKD